MPHYTDKEKDEQSEAMSYEEFSKLLKDRYEKGESTDEYSYKSNITIEKLITKEENELTQLTLRHNEIVEYQNDNPSFYHDDDEELDELMDKMKQKEDFVVKLKREIK